MSSAATTAVIVGDPDPGGKGKPSGALAGVLPVDLLSGVLEALVARNDLDPALVEDVMVGCAQQVREQAANIARAAVLDAGFPESVLATTVNRQCGSSQQTAAFAAQSIMARVHDVVGGMANATVIERL